MRRAAVLLALVALCAAFAGCGGHSDETVTPLDDAVGYFAKDAPFVAAIETHPDSDQVKQLQALVRRVPGAGILVGRVHGLVRIPFLRWDRDIRPQIGAPLVVGLVRPAAGSGLSTALVAAMRVKHPLRAKQTLLRQPGFRGASKSSGVRIYENSTDRRYVAVDGDTVVAATDRDILEQALAIKRTDNRMRETGFNRDLAGLPADDLLRVSADPRAFIGVDPRLRPALGVKWIASLRRLGAVAQATPDGMTLDFHAATDPSAITTADLPLAPKARPIPLLGKRGEIQVGLAEPDRLARFAFQVADAIAPKRMALLRALEPKGVELERQVPHHLADLLDLSIAPRTKNFGLRSGLIESGDVRSALTQLAPALPAAAALFGMPGLGVATPETGENFYALAKPNGRTVVFGIVGDKLVAASQARRAAALATQRTHLAPGNPKGAVVFTIPARDLPVAPLGDVTGVLTNSRKGLNGHLEMKVVK